MNTLFHKQIIQFHELRRNPQTAMRVFCNKKWMWHPICFHCRQRDESALIEHSMHFCNRCKDIIDYHNDSFESKACFHSFRKKRTYASPFSISYVKTHLQGNKLLINVDKMQFQKIQKDIGDFLYSSNFSKDTLLSKNFCNCMTYDFDTIVAHYNHKCEYITHDYKCNPKGIAMLNEHVDVGGTILIDYKTNVNKYNLHFVATIIKEA